VVVTCVFNLGKTETVVHEKNRSSLLLGLTDQKAMAASVAAQLSKENDVEVATAKGGLGEFSVSIDGEKVIETNCF
jgi:hypothetical protein